MYSIKSQAATENIRTNNMLGFNVATHKMITENYDNREQIFLSKNVNKRNTENIQLISCFGMLSN